MLWGVESHVIERFGKAGIAPENISFNSKTYTFEAHYSPTEFLHYFKKFYGPTMNAFEAAEKNGKANELQKELETLFNQENKASDQNTTSIPATYLKVTILK